MSILRITIVQSDIIWESGYENLHKYEHMLEGTDESDIIILPEMFSSGFSLFPLESVIKFSQRALEWMKKIASDKNSAICGSQVTRENSNLYNRLYFVKPDGEVNYYDKKHLFSIAWEPRMYTAGIKKSIVSYKGFNLALFICYDLRFPVWCCNRYDKNTGRYDYDIGIYVANWPEKRIMHWENLLQARAIENQVYVCGVNRIGVDKNRIFYSGSSMVIDPFGNIIKKAEDNTETVFTVELSMADLIDIRTNLPFASDWDNFTIID